MSEPVFTLTIGEGDASTFQALGILAASLERRNRGPNALSLVFACAELAPVAGTVVVLARDGVTEYTGRALEPVTVREESPMVSVVVLDAWRELEECPLTLARTSWDATAEGLASVPTSRVILGADPATGDPERTDETLARIIARLETQGAPTLSAGALFTGVLAPSSEAVDISALDAVRQVLRWHPDVVAWIASNGGFNAKTLANLAPVTVDADAVKLSFSARQVPRGIRIIWERVSTVDGVQRVERIPQTAGATTGWPPPLEITLPLAGAETTTERVDVHTRTLPKDGVSNAAKAKFFRGLLPWLADADLDDVAVDDLEIEIVDPSEDDLDTDGATVNPNSKPFPPGGGSAPDLSAFSRQLLSPSSIPDWVGQAYPARIKARIAYKGTPTKAIADNLQGRGYSAAAGGFYLVGTVDEGITVTDAKPKVYDRLESATAGQVPVGGLAAAFYAAATAAGKSGTVSGPVCALATAIPGAEISVGDDVSNAPVQSASWDLINGEASVAFGMPDHLSAQDLLALSQVGNEAPPKWTRPEEHEDAEPDAGKSIGGPSGGSGGGKLHASGTKLAMVRTPWELDVAGSSVRVLCGRVFDMDNAPMSITGESTAWTLANDDVLCLKATVATGIVTAMALEKVTVATWERVTISGGDVVAVRFPLWVFKTVSAASVAVVGSHVISDTVVGQRCAPVADLIIAHGYVERASGENYLTVAFVPWAGHSELG